MVAESKDCAMSLPHRAVDVFRALSYALTKEKQERSVQTSRGTREVCEEGNVAAPEK